MSSVTSCHIITSRHIMSRHNHNLTCPALTQQAPAGDFGKLSMLSAPLPSQPLPERRASENGPALTNPLHGLASALRAGSVSGHGRFACPDRQQSPCVRPRVTLRDLQLSPRGSLHDLQLSLHSPKERRKSLSLSPLAQNEHQVCSGGSLSLGRVSHVQSSPLQQHHYDNRPRSPSAADYLQSMPISGTGPPSSPCKAGKDARGSSSGPRDVCIPSTPSLSQQLCVQQAMHSVKGMILELSEECDFEI